MDTVRVAINYGNLKQGQDYKVVSAGRDWLLVRCQGKLVYFPKNLQGW